MFRLAAVGRILLPVIGSLGLLCQSAQAQLLFQEGFNYTAGADLYDNGSWNAAPGTDDTSGGITVGSGPLSYSGATWASSGNSAVVAAGTTASTWINDAPLSSPVSSGSIYVSYLFSINSLIFGYNQNSTFLGLLPANSGGTTLGYASATDPCDLVIKTDTSGNNYGLGIRTGSGIGTQYTGLSLLQSSTTYLVVMKYTFGATGTATLWIDPAASTFGGTSDPTSANSLGSAVCTSTTDLPSSISAFYLRQAPYVSGTGSYDPAPPYTIDDIEIGTSYAAVTSVVPEPASMALIGLGLVGLILSRRTSRPTPETEF
jgi:hypothetical protein